MTMRIFAWVAAALLLGTGPAAAQKVETVELTAKLVKIPGKFPPDDLYDYAYVMQYAVVGGKRDKETIYVAHYKPRRARKKIRDKMRKHVAGKLQRFREGELHRLKLTRELRKIWKGALVDDFFAKDRKSTRYWCLRVDPIKK
jgi:hypothetical protein